MGIALSLLRSKETNEMVAEMKHLLNVSWGRRHENLDELYYAVKLVENPKKLNLRARYQGWNVLHVAAYHGAGRLIYNLVGEKGEIGDHGLFTSVNYPQRASVLMCIAYGHTAGLATEESTFEQAGFKLVYRLSDADLRYRDPRGCTALHYAAVHGVVNMVAALIERGIDLQARGRMDDEGDSSVGLALTRYGEPPDRTLRTPLECAELRLAVASKWLPSHANSQVNLRRVIKLLQQATGAQEPAPKPKPEPDAPSEVPMGAEVVVAMAVEVGEALPMAIPVITTMLTVATAAAGEKMSVATPKGPHPVEVPLGCTVGTFFQFELDEPIPVADFRAWPRQIVKQTTSAADLDGDGVADVVAPAMIVETKDGHVMGMAC